MRILLAYKSDAAGSGDPYTSLLPVGLGYVNACLQVDGHQSAVANLSIFKRKKTEELIRKLSPGIVGISQFTHNRHESTALAQLVKKINPSTLVVFGGPHASGRAGETLSACHAVDAVVVGEGEETFRELASTLRKGEGRLDQVNGLVLRRRNEIVFTPPRDRIENLDLLPMPARHFDNSVGVDLRRQLEFIITSRGCPAACRFCSSPGFWGRKVRFRSPREIIDEMRYIRDRYGIIYFSIRDDTFTADRERAMTFCRLLVDEKQYLLWNCQSRIETMDDELLAWMKRAGCECIQYGIESGSPSVLRKLGKRMDMAKVRLVAAATKRAGINLSIYLITGVHGENESDLDETLRLIDDLRANDGQVSPLAYYPGTFLFERDVSTGLVRQDLFEAEKASALFVRHDPFVSVAKKRLLAGLSKAAIRGRYTAADFLTQKKLLGYCHTTNILAGEYYENEGKWIEAEREYQEIAKREAENPWGWLLLHELYSAMGDFEKAMVNLERVRKLVPNYEPDGI